MTIWINGEPSAKANRAIVFIDFDNFAITAGDGKPWVPISGQAHPDHLLKMARSFGRHVGRKRPLVFLFVNAHKGAIDRQLERVCESMGVFMIHCPYHDSKDQVDVWLQHAMQRLEPVLERENPLVLVSADSDFANAVKRIRDHGRPVYIAVPTNAFTPRHVRGRGACATGSAWIDPDANLHRAMHFLLRQKRFNKKSWRYIHSPTGFQREFPYFTQLRGAIDHLARLSIKRRSLEIAGSPEDLYELLRWTAVSWEECSYIAFGKAEARTLLPYLVAYNFFYFDRRDGVFRINHNHPRVRHVKGRRDGQPPPRLQVVEAS